MVNLVGRKFEQDELNDVLNSKTAEFLVIYGRRRIGKTYLIEEFFKNKQCVFFHLTGIQDALLHEHLSEFAKILGNTFYHGANLIPPDTWLNAFTELTKAIENNPEQKIILFFDELPWLASKRSRILQALDYYWNRVWSKNKNIKLIICGSSASWIMKNIINNKGGLHNRYTRSILLKPFTLYETKQFLFDKKVKLNDQQILNIYMAMGGIPHYLNQIKRGKSAGQNINQLCFNQNGLLFSEFDKLFKSLFNDASKYIELIKIIAGTNYGVERKQIEAKSKLTGKGGILTERLNDLELAGFIKSFLPLGHGRKGIYYRVIDEYSLFYLKWIEPEKKTLIAEESLNKYWESKLQTPKYNSWSGYAFESVCYKHISQIRRALNILPGTRVGSWRYSPRKSTKEAGAQIDLIFEHVDQALTICEIKYTNNPFIIDKEYFLNIENKINTYKRINRSKQQVFVAFISANGVQENIYSEELVDQVVLLQDLYLE